MGDCWPVISRKGTLIQIQDGFSGRSLTEIAERGIDLYEWIPDFRDQCPLCGGRNCAVRHGLYYRRVLDRCGRIHERFPIPRFRCSRRGQREPEAVTFSVLPDQLLPRRSLSLPLMLWLLYRFVGLRASISQVLDELAALFAESSRLWFPDASIIYRSIRLFALAHRRLSTSKFFRPYLLDGAGRPFAGEASSAKDRARELLAALRQPVRGSPLPLAYHRRLFPRLLFSPQCL